MMLNINLWSILVLGLGESVLKLSPAEARWQRQTAVEPQRPPSATEEQLTSEII